MLGWSKWQDKQHGYAVIREWISKVVSNKDGAPRAIRCSDAACTDTIRI